MIYVDSKDIRQLSIAKKTKPTVLWSRMLLSFCILHHPIPPSIYVLFSSINFSAWKVCIFRVFLVRMSLYLNWIRRYLVTFRIQSEWRRIQTRNTPNADTLCSAYLCRDSTSFLKFVDALQDFVLVEISSFCSATSYKECYFIWQPWKSNCWACNMNFYWS